MRTAFRLLSLLLTLRFLLPAHRAADASTRTATRDTVFIGAEIDNRRPYVGQEALLTYSLYFSGIAPRIADTGKAEHPGIWVREVTPEGYIASTPATVGGRTYRKALIKQLRVVPMQSGRLSISNYRLRCLLPPPGDGITADSGKEIENIVTAPTTRLVARPLPRPEPPGFSGAVGEFSLSLPSDRYEGHPGIPLTITVRLDGKGSLKAFPTVEVVVPDGFSKEAPAATTAVEGKGRAPDEAVATNIVITPDRPGTFRFTPVRLTTFNPRSGRYETLSTREITLHVLPGAPQAAASPPQSPTKGTTDNTSLLSRAAIVAMALGAVALISVLVLLASSRRTPLPSAALRESRPERRKHAHTSPESVRKELYDALRHLGITKPAGKTSSELKKALAARNVDDAAAQALAELLQQVEQAMYTPGKTSAERLRDLERNASEVIASISKHA